MSINTVKVNKIEVDSVSVSSSDITDAGIVGKEILQAETRQEAWEVVEPTEINAVLIPVKGAPEVIDDYLGTEGEFVSDSETMRLMDGITPGGIKMATDSQINLPPTLTLISDENNNIKGYPLTIIPESWADTTGISYASKGLGIGYGVTTIEPFAFFEYSSLAGWLVIPNTVTLIEESAFEDCDGFIKLSLGKGLITIGPAAFKSCSGFTGELNICSPIQELDFDAFRLCSGFQSLVIGDSLLTIGTSCFRSCAGFIGNLIIGKSVSTINNNAFDGCVGFGPNLEIPPSVTTIGGSAFNNCAGLTNVNCYVSRSVMNAANCLLGTLVTTIHVLENDSSWTAGADTIGGKAVTVIKDL
jgi:hypothetical protein